SESPRVTVLLVSSRDSVLPDSLERLTEVSERLVVLVLGIHLQSSGLLPELVNMVTITELKSTRRSTELVLVLTEVLRITPPLRLMLLKRTLLLSEVSLTTVLSTTTTSWLRVALLVLRRDSLPSERVLSLKLTT